MAQVGVGKGPEGSKLNSSHKGPHRQQSRREAANTWVLRTFPQSSSWGLFPPSFIHPTFIKFLVGLWAGFWEKLKFYSPCSNTRDTSSSSGCLCVGVPFPSLCHLLCLWHPRNETQFWNVTLLNVKKERRREVLSLLPSFSAFPTPPSACLPSANSLARVQVHYFSME